MATWYKAHEGLLITPPTGWIAERNEDGLLVVPPGGIEQGVVRYTERCRPIRRIAELIHLAGRPSGFRTSSMSAPERFMTDEGEHAALVTVRGAIGDVPAELCYGFVFLDDHYSRLTSVGLAGADEIRTQVQRMLRGELQLVGHLRRRRFFYHAPPGWSAMGDLFQARWYPPDHPANPSRIFVGPALPLVANIEERILVRLAGAAAELHTRRLGPTRHTKTRRGLIGQHHHLRLSEAVETHIVLLHDHTFLYSVRVDVHSEVALALAQDLVESIEPVPRPQESKPAVADVIAHWVS